jgi:hypothetical protein
LKPRVGVVQFRAVCPEGNERPLACGITYEIARRMSTVGGVDASAILPGGPQSPWGGSDSGPEGTSPEMSLSVEKATGLSAPSLGAQFESDFLVVGTVNVADGLLLNYRVYEVENGRVLCDGNLTGLRSDVFRLLDELGRGVQGAIGYLPEDDEEEPDFNPVYDSVDFDAFTEYCLAREATLPRNALDHLERALRREPGFRMALVEYLSHCYQVDELCHSLELMNAYLCEYEDDQEILIAAANLCLAFNVVDEGLGYATSAKDSSFSAMLSINSLWSCSASSWNSAAISPAFASPWPAVNASCFISKTSITERDPDPPGNWTIVAPRPKRPLICEIKSRKSVSPRSRWLMTNIAGTPALLAEAQASSVPT